MWLNDINSPEMMNTLLHSKFYHHHQKVHEFKSQDLANTLWAMAKTGSGRKELFEVFCQASVEKVVEFDLQQIAMTLWAMAKTGASRPEFVAALRRRAVQRLASPRASEATSPDESSDDVARSWEEMPMISPSGTVIFPRVGQITAL